MADIKMKNTIGVDIGGTFTDCYVVWRGEVIHDKQLTTRYNLSAGLMKAVTGCAKALGVPVTELLENTDLVRYATTLAMNALIERSGPKLGLITTAGQEDTIFIGKGSQHYDALPLEIKRNFRTLNRPEPLIPRELVVGLRERVDYAGKVVMPLKREDVEEKLQYLVNKGVTGFVVCLLWSFMNPAHEQMVREVIKEEYPDVYLGSQPVLLSSEVLPKKGEYQRSMTTILTAYLHRSMAEELSALAEELRDKGYKHSLFLVHNTGGIATLYETISVKTYNAGPIGGLTASRFVGKLYGCDNIIASDVGGTSFDIGVIAGGDIRFYNYVPLIDWWRVGLTMIETKSIGAGGGSIAKINEIRGGALEVGPESAGSMPGPACFDFGGEEPTVTDADVVLGYINPDYFLGGELRLNKEKAIEAIRQKIAKPLNISVEEAALSIKQILDGRMGNEIFKEVQLRGYDPRDFVLIAYGGAGPAHCCGYGSFADAKKIIVPLSSSVFSAFGVSITDIVLLYESSKYVRLYDYTTKSYLSDHDKFNGPVKELQEKAIEDMKKQGFKPEDIVLSLELGMKYGQQRNTTEVNSPRIFVRDEDDIKAVADEFIRAYERTYSASSAYPEGGIEVMGFCLKSMVIVSKPHIPALPSRGTDPGKALKGTRKAFWKEGFMETNVYQQDALECGNVVEGPAIIEATDTTCVLPQGMELTIDKYLNGIIEKIS